MLLSIIIPAYNVEKYIKKILQLLTSQMSNDCEIIVVNDGSTDNTLCYAKEVANTNNRIFIINQKNLGVSVARNKGIEFAQGKYLYFLDADDTLEKDSLSFFLETIGNNSNHSIYAFGYKSKNDNKEKKYASTKYNKQILKNPLLKQIFLSKKLCFHICSTIYEKKFVIENNLFFTPGVKIGEDIEFILKALDKAQSLFYSSRQCFIYQIRNDSAMKGYKAYSKTQYHSFEIRRDLCLNDFYQSQQLKYYSNFWIENQLLSNIAYYLKSSVVDNEITQNLIKDCELLKKTISTGNIRNYIAIVIAKILPMKFILRKFKSYK